MVGADPESLRFGSFVPVDPERHTVLDVMLLLGKYALHRVFVCNAAGDIHSIVSQTRIVELLHANLRSLAPLTSRTLGELGLVRMHRVLVTAAPETPFHEALRLMREHSVSAVPIVDPATGALVGTVSASDARLALHSPAHFAALGLPLTALLSLRDRPFDATFGLAGECGGNADLAPHGKILFV